MAQAVIIEMIVLLHSLILKVLWRKQTWIDLPIQNKGENHTLNYD